MNDEVIMENLTCLRHIIQCHISRCFSVFLYQINILLCQYPKSVSLFYDQIISQILNLPCKTCLKSLVIKEFVFDRNTRAINSLCLENKFVYWITAHEKSLAFDLSTCALWHAIVLLMKQEYTSTLRILSQVSCSIPPYAMSQSFANFMIYQEPTDTEQLPCSSCLYVDKFLQSEYSTMKRAKEAWLLDLSVAKTQSEAMPLGIQIELYFCNTVINHVYLSPFTCLFYLMFLCYHELHQYDSRDCALRQLVDVANNSKQCGRWPYHSYNIAGHCLLIAGEIDRARDMFSRSHQKTLLNSLLDMSNSALWYLQNFCS